MDDIVGAWELTAFLADPGDAEPRELEEKLRRPLGEKPSGMLLYTADGWMSALLTAETRATGNRDRAAVLESLGAPLGTVAYAGRWEYSEDGAVLHHVRYSHYEPWVGTILKRAARHDADELELTASVPGFGLTLHWRRARV